MEESVNQLKQLRMIEDVEQAIFSLERGMPAHPRIIGTMKTLLHIMAVEYNTAYAEKPEGAGEAPPNE